MRPSKIQGNFMKAWIYNVDNSEIVAVITGNTNKQCENKAVELNYMGCDEYGLSYSADKLIETDTTKHLQAMLDEEKIEVAKRFIEAHKENKFRDWGAFDEAGLVECYDNLCFGVYGEVTYLNELKEECGMEDAFESLIEIGRHESKTGNPVIFEF
jgi:hypothetical protein